MKIFGMAWILAKILVYKHALSSISTWNVKDSPQIMISPPQPPPTPKKINEFYFWFYVQGIIFSNRDINRRLKILWQIIDFQKRTYQTHPGLYDNAVIKIHAAPGNMQRSSPRMRNISDCLAFKTLRGSPSRDWKTKDRERTRKDQRAQYLRDRTAMCWDRRWKKKFAPWRNTTTPVHPSTNNSTIISFLMTITTRQGLIALNADTEEAVT